MRIAIQNMLLIEDPSIVVVKDAMTKIASYFVFPSFVIALTWEYFNEFNFFEVVKKLILVLIFMGAFYSVHKEGVDLSLKYSDELLREISPRNVFLRKWGEVKIKANTEKTSQKTGWNVIDNFVVPNLNDLIGTAFFLMSKLAIWILKLVYSTVYHLTYIFAPLTAVLYFFPITKGSISGSIFSSIWCMILPFVLVAILALVGNSMQQSADQGELIFSSMDQILWLFGVTLLIASTPIITLGLLKGGGIALSGSAIGAMTTNSAMKLLRGAPIVAGGIKTTSKGATKLGSKAFLEPSIKEMLKKERENSPINEKLKQLNKKGGIRNPFKGQQGLDERLAKIGMTKDEAISLSKTPTKSRNNTQAETSRGKTTNSQKSFNRQEQETFLFDKSFWNKITPEHREGIRSKYGINGDLPISNKLYYPVSRSERMGIKNSLRESHVPSTIRKPEANKMSMIQKKESKERDSLRGKNL